MPAWNELLNETKAAGSTHDVIRRKYLRRLANYTKRNVIIYYSGWLQKAELLRQQGIGFGISDNDKAGFMSVIHKLQRVRGLDLLIHTPGGDMAATESLVDYLRQMFDDDIRAIIPQIAMSGGTIMALGSNQIIMGKESNIGPIDPQFGSTAATGLIQEFERIRKEIKADAASALLWQPILSQVRPGFITECENAVKWARRIAERSLNEVLFKGARNKAERVQKVIDHLTDKKTTITHGRHIGIDEAKDLFGDKLVALEDDQRLQDLVLTVHHATVITLQATNAFKIIENHTGRAFVQQVHARVAPPGN